MARKISYFQTACDIIYTMDSGQGNTTEPSGAATQSMPAASTGPDPQTSSPTPVALPSSPAVGPGSSPDMPLSAPANNEAVAPATPVSQPITSANIAPPPDPTQASARSATSSGSVVEPASSTAHPFVSHHPTQTFSAETGDIVLRKEINPKSKKSLKWILLAAIIIIVVMLVGVGVVVLLGGGKDGQSSNASSTETFDRFATYLLQGSSSNELTGEYRSDKAYQLDHQLEDGGSDSSYWTTSNELLTKVMETYTSGDQANPYLVRTLKEYQRTFNFINTYRQLRDPTDEQILNRYLSSGQTGVDKFLADFYEKYNVVDSLSAEEYSYHRTNQYRTLSETFALYNRRGCLHGDQLDETCADNLAADEELYALQQSFDTSKQAADQILSDAKQKLVQNCWWINAQIKNPIVDPEEENAE